MTTPHQPPAVETKPTNGLESEPGPRGRRDRMSGAGSALGRLEDELEELTVCDITGDWGAYQWSLCLFALTYSTFSAFVVMFGPILMPDIPFACSEAGAAGLQVAQNKSGASAAAASSQHEFCFVKNATANGEQEIKCTKFAYDDRNHGLMLTNGFDLVCDRLWLRSLITSSALVGMLLSSVSLGLFSDKFGRLRCIQAGFVISCLANVVALFVKNYYLFNVCIMLMCFAQIGAANALCTLLMEATSPRFRYVPTFEYSLGWAIGMALLPPMNWITHDFRWFMGLLLVWQVAMLPWLHWGVFESIRWLLSEGHLNRAQIELRRACRMNNVQTNERLALRIAQMQAQQVRKASRVISHEQAPVQLSRALGARVDETARELDTLSAAIKRSFFGELDSDDEDELEEFGRDCHAPAGGEKAGPPATSLETASALSPSLARASFSLTSNSTGPRDKQQHQQVPAEFDPQQRRRTQNFLLPNMSQTFESLSGLVEDPNRKQSISTQGLIQLAMKYSKTVRGQEQGQCFMVQMFHAKLWRQSIILLLISVMFETSYYGLLQANKFVGSSVDLNYFMSALGEFAAALATCFMLAFCSRRLSIVVCMLLGSLICLSMALTYQLVPDSGQPAAGAAGLLNYLSEQFQGVLAARDGDQLNGTTTSTGTPPLVVNNLIDNEAHLEPMSGAKLFGAENATNSSTLSADQARRALLGLRNEVNFYLMTGGKFFISVGIQVAGTVAMEVYPNNLRQTGPGVILFAGRLGSIIAPFLFNDPTPEKLTFKLTLVVLAAIGLLVCVLVPFFIRNTKDKELCDQLDEIE